MDNLDDGFLAEEIKTRNKINQLFYLLKDAQIKEGYEKEEIVSKALELVSQLYIHQDKRIGQLLSQEQIISATAKEKKEEKKGEPSKTTKERDIFAENPFEGKLTEIPMENLDNLISGDLLTEIPEAEDESFSDLPKSPDEDFSPDLIHSARSAFFEATQEEDDDEGIEIKTISTKEPSPKKAKPFKLKSEEIERTQELLSYLQKTQNLQELAQIESEIEISGNEFNCIAHKGSIGGSSYICPKCKSLYCLECAINLKKENKLCILCNLTIQV